MEEIWKDIPGYEGYQITIDGKVKFLSKIVKCAYNSKRIMKSKILNVGISNSGYFYCCIGFIHRLIAITFLENPENKPCVNHKNGIKTDNKLENLEWCTRSENAIHACKNGLIINHNWKNKKVGKFNLEGELLNIYRCINEAGEKTGIHKSTISWNCNGKRKTAGGFIWKYITN